MSRPYDTEFKIQAIRLVQPGTKATREIARELGIPKKARYGWMEAMRQRQLAKIASQPPAGPRRFPESMLGVDILS